MTKLFIVAFISFVGCQYDRIPYAKNLSAIIEKGTDSTYKRAYFPNPNKSLYAVSA